MNVRNNHHNIEPVKTPATRNGATSSTPTPSIGPTAAKARKKVKVISGFVAVSITPEKKCSIIVTALSFLFYLGFGVENTAKSPMIKRIRPPIRCSVFCSRKINSEIIFIPNAPTDARKISVTAEPKPVIRPIRRPLDIVLWNTTIPTGPIGIAIAKPTTIPHISARISLNIMTIE